MQTSAPATVKLREDGDHIYIFVADSAQKIAILTEQVFPSTGNITCGTSQSCHEPASGVTLNLKTPQGQVAGSSLSKVVIVS